MQCLLNFILVLFFVGSSILQTSQNCYAQANKAPSEDSTLNDLVLQGDSTTVSEEQEVVVIEEDSTEVVTNLDVFKGPESVLIERLKKIENKVPLSFNPRIKSFMQYFTVRNRHYSLVMERRRRLYFPIFEDVFRELGVPDELKYLAIVESGLNPRALSRAGAAGLWQFMPATGRSFGLYQDEYIDERLDPYYSTVAAAKYLKQLSKTFDSWEFGISSYNCGPGNVRRAIRKSGYSNSFWNAYNYMPAETRGYLPQLVALTYAMNYLNEHDIIADSLDYPISFDTITLKQYINLEVFTKELNVAMEDFVELNPSFLKNYFPGHRPVLIRIPSDKMVYYAQNEAHILDLAGKRDVAVKEIPVLVKSYSQKASSTTKSTSTKTKIIYTVRSGDVLGKIADKHNVGLTQIKNWNSIKGTTIHPGQKLIIYKSGGSYSSSTASSSSSSKNSPSKIPNYYYVRSGDTLWTISKKYDGLTVEKIKQLNNLKDGNIKPGQKLKLI